MEVRANTSAVVEISFTGALVFIGMEGEPVILLALYKRGPGVEAKLDLSLKPSHENHQRSVLLSFPAIVKTQATYKDRY